MLQQLLAREKLVERWQGGGVGGGVNKLQDHPEVYKIN